MSSGKRGRASAGAARATAVASAISLNAMLAEERRAGSYRRPSLFLILYLFSFFQPGAVYASLRDLWKPHGGVDIKQWIREERAGGNSCGVGSAVACARYPSQPHLGRLVAEPIFPCPFSFQHNCVRCVRQQLSHYPMWSGHATPWVDPQPPDHCAAVPRHACPCPPTLMQGHTRSINHCSRL